jgi:ABC-type transport system involved in cytochrome c biogenesis permease component
MDSVRKTLILIGHELRLEWRLKDTGTVAVILGALSVLLFGFAIRGRGTLVVTRLFEHERLNGVLDALVLAPGGRGSVHAAKLISGWLYVMAAGAVMSLLAHWLWAQRGLTEPRYWMVMALGALGMAAMGTMVAAAGSGSGEQPLLALVVLLPLEVPVVICGIRATQMIAAGHSPQLWIRGLLAYDTIFVTLSVLLSDYLWEV